MSIQPLPSDVIAQIKSSSTITSLNGVIFELVKNSLDASCSKIDIVVDYSRGDCTVEDNGHGILPSEFDENGGLGKLYHSSRLHSLSPTHGGYGTFIASLSALSLIYITSHHHLHRSHNSISMHRSEVVSRQIPAPVQHHLIFEHGTRVTVRNLFGSMPVRVKQRVIASEKRQINSKLWDALRKDIVSLLLAWPKNVSVSIKEDGTDQKVAIRRSRGTVDWRAIGTIDLSNTCSILSKASYITADEKSSWIPVSGSTSSLAVNGAISLIANATKHIQFLALGIEPLLSRDNSNILYEDINRWFANSSFGNQEEANELDELGLEKRSKDRRYKVDGYTNKELKGGRKSVDRWPMFYINIHQVDQTNNSRWKFDNALDEKRNTTDRILTLLQAVIMEFLTKNHFRPKLARGSRKTQVALTESPTNLEEQTHSGPSGTGLSDQTTKPSSTTTEDSSHDHGEHTENQATVDMLGTKVKLPSFRQSHSEFHSPFESWSKIKTGSKHSSKTPVDTTQNSNMNPLWQDSLTIEPRTTTPLISKSGKLIRCPFEEIPTPRPELPLPTDKVQQFDVNGDELVMWTNPINKVKSRVNKRTGLVVSEMKEDKNIRNKLISNQSPRLTIIGKPRTGDKQPNIWIDDVLNKWENPIFAPAEPSIPQVSVDGLELETQEIIHGRHYHCSQIEIEKAFKETSSGLHGRISKDALHNAEAISQVDKKFILVNLQTRSMVSGEPSTLLVIIDQHAADERIRIETLLSDFLTPPTVSTNSASVSTSRLEKHLTFDITTKDSQLFHAYMNHFSYWGILYSLSSTAITLTVHHLPPLITARLVANPSLLLHILRTELYSYHEHPTSHPKITPTSTWIERISHIPKGVLELLNSRACRSAIMFNDELGIGECRELVRRLANCKFPFICAHGRVSMVPLGEVGMMSRGGGNRKWMAMLNKDRGLENDGTFGVEWGKWMKRRGEKQ